MTDERPSIGTSSTPVATVSVAGSGVVGIVPDAARLRVAASARADTVAGATLLLSDAVDRLVRVATAHVADSAVASAGLQVWPRHDDGGRVVGAEATQQLQVLCPGLDVASLLVTELADAVGEELRVEGLDLEVSDTSGAVFAAREAAFADARARASHLAELAGRSLGEVLTVGEGNLPGVGFPVAERAVLAAMPIQPGQRDVRVDLNVTWQLV